MCGSAQLILRISAPPSLSCPHPNQAEAHGSEVTCEGHSQHLQGQEKDPSSVLSSQDWSSQRLGCLQVPCWAMQGSTLGPVGSQRRSDAVALYVLSITLPYPHLTASLHVSKNQPRSTAVFLGPASALGSLWGLHGKTLQVNKRQYIGRAQICVLGGSVDGR